MKRRRIAGIGLAFLGLALVALAWMSPMVWLPGVVVLVFLPVVLVVFFGAGRAPARLGCWIAPLVVVVGLFVTSFRLPKLGHPPRWSVLATSFKHRLRDYGREADDYPKNARELVRDVVPRKFAGADWRITALSDDRLVVEDRRFRKEVEYRYVSPDFFLLVWDE